MNFSDICLISLSFVCLCHSSMSLEVDKAFNEHQVVPDVIPVAPTGLLKV